ncbi:MAG: (2Fe-2S)-binding protein [Proteobacteria bacterium]|nr:(2Fe-2S)-binding protein [Pseudomonadota bacterium]
MQISCDINGKAYTRHIEPDSLLIDFLRDLGFLSLKQGCDTTNCGLCTVWVDGRPRLSCAMLAAGIQGRQITTIEGVEKEAAAFGQFLAAQGADQCGFCSPGFIMNVLAMERELSDPSDDQIRHYLAGNLCRCTGYAGQMRAITRYLGARKGELSCE